MQGAPPPEGRKRFCGRRRCCRHFSPAPFFPPLRDTYVKQEPGETPNDRNDRAIRRTAEWYAERLPGKPILLLTDDAANRVKAAEAGLTAKSSVVRGSCSLALTRPGGGPRGCVNARGAGPRLGGGGASCAWFGSVHHHPF